MKIFLRPVEESDGTCIVRWRNDPSVSCRCFSREPITLESNRDFFESQVKTGRYLQFMVERVEEQSGAAYWPIASVYLKDIDQENKRCELCVFTSSDEEWNQESQAIAIAELVKRAFDDLGMHKVYSYVFLRFHDEVELLKRAGFSTEAVLKDEVVFEDGSFEDVLRLSVFNE